jgi:hypothetical protein
MGYEPTEPIWSIIGFIFRVHLNPKYKPYKFRGLFGGNLEGIKRICGQFLDPLLAMEGRLTRARFGIGWSRF